MSEAIADDQLLRRAQHGDDRAFAQLLDRHAAYLFGVARASLRGDHDAKDAVQECLSAALRARYDGAAAVRTWLVGILIRQIALARRKRKRWAQEADQPPPAPVPDVSREVVLTRCGDSLTQEILFKKIFLT